MIWFVVCFMWLQWYSFQHEDVFVWKLSWWFMLVWVVFAEYR